MVKRIIQILLGCSLLASTGISVYAGENGYVDEHNTFGKGKAFFQSSVMPKLAENGCFKCHARGYVRPNVTQYEELIRRLAIGDSDVNNAIIYKLANIRSISPEIPNHPGGQRCATIDNEPCKSIRQWWRIEFARKEADQ